MEAIALCAGVPNQCPLDGCQTAGSFKDGLGIDFKLSEPSNSAHLVVPLFHELPLNIGGEGHRVVNILLVIGNHFTLICCVPSPRGVDICRRVTAPARS